jgi:hypothetical protein
VLYPLLSRTCNKNKFKNSSKERINFLLQHKWNNFFKKHVDVEHIIIVKVFEEEIISLLKAKEKK